MVVGFDKDGGEVNSGGPGAPLQRPDRHVIFRFRLRCRLEQAVVLIMRADPKPSDGRGIKNTQSAVSESDTDGINVLHLHPFESEARMRGVGLEEPVSPARLRLHLVRQGG